MREVTKMRRRSGPVATMFPPVVWIFDDQCPVTSFQSTEDPLTEDDWYHSSFLYSENETRLMEGRIKAFKLAAYVDLFLSRCISGPGSESWTPARQKAAAMAYLRRVPPEKRCQRLPWRDEELQPFQGVDQALAAAVKYAADEVILVSRSSGPVARDVAAYARGRGVTICRMSIDDFDRQRLERFRWFHFVPSPGDSFQPPYESCWRFVPPI